MVFHFSFLVFNLDLIGFNSKLIAKFIWQEEENIFRNLSLSFLSALLLVLAFPNFSQGWLAFLALIPLLLLIFRSTLNQAFFYSLLTGLLFFSGLLSWLLAIKPWAGVPLTILAWSLLSVAEALSFALFGAGASFIQKNFPLGGRLFFIPALWITLEFLRSLGPWGFSWGVLGLTQTSNLLTLQWAKVLGVFGLSYILLFFNICFTELFLSPFKIKKSLFYLSGIIALLLLLLGSGLYSLKKPPQSFSLKRNFFKVALVQGNIVQEEKFAINTQEKVEVRYLGLTKEAVKERPYLIIWPETALPRFFDEERAYLQETLSLTRSKSYLLAGALREDKQGRQYNSAFLFSPQGRVTGSYDKIKLVLFGEYVPPFPPFSNIKALAGLGESITAGKKMTLFKTTKGRLGPLICFESANPFLARKMIKEGAEMFVVITNDAWFGRTAAARQHLEMLRMRAVENGVFGLQVGGTGISGIIDPQGRILKESALFKKEILFGKVALLEGKTFYTSYGYLFPWFALTLTLISLILLILRKLPKKFWF